jgi:hypothetical protein
MLELITVACPLNVVGVCVAWAVGTVTLANGTLVAPRAARHTARTKRTRRKRRDIAEPPWVRTSPRATAAVIL